MRKKKVGIIGYGKWAKKVIPIINKICKIHFISNTKNSYKLQDHNVDWVFVLSNNESHYKIVKYFLSKKINVFCEKPLTESLTQSKKLIDYSNKKKTKLFISEVELFKNKKIPKSRRFKIRREKFEKIEKFSSPIIYRLAYHDFYLLFETLKREIIRKISYKNQNKQISIKINTDKTEYNFNYNLNIKKQSHFINNINFNNFSGNPFKKMIKNVLSNKVNFKSNNTRAIFCNYLISKIKRYETSF